MDPDFRQRYALWIECLVGEDRNSVFNQINQMVQDAAVFNIVNEARRTAPPAPEGGVMLNGMVHRFIDRNFFRCQMVAVRRLIDRAGLRGKRGVYSLGSLIADMMQHVHLLTRANLFAAAGLPIDAEPVRRQQDAYLRERWRADEAAVAIPPELDYERIEERHDEIDRLCGVRPDQRTEGDTVRATLLCAMLKKLRECKRIAIYVNKFVAHAATPESRLDAKADDIRLVMKHLRRTQEMICRTAACLDRYLLRGAAHVFLPVTGEDLFRYIDRPLVPGAGVAALRDEWKRFDEESRGWGEGKLEWLTDEEGDHAGGVA